VSGPFAGSDPRGAAALGDPRAAFAAETSAAVVEAARQGLLRARKKLPPWLLYDDAGSALFEEITRLPEYYLTRAEREILRRDAGAILDAAGSPLEVIELGAGSASKTRLLLAALLARQPRVRYLPVDVSPAALEQARAELRGLRHLEVVPVAARYPEELGFLRLPTDARRLVLFMGSNIGNYDLPSARRLLVGVRRCLSPGDALMVGADRRKSEAVLLPAYDDAAGVTARFNKNGLARFNRELGATFDLERFRHVARWNSRASRMELYLESTVAQRVWIPALGAHATFAARERIHTEWSYKLTGARMRQLLASAGFVPEAAWTDEGRRFGVTLARVPARPRRGTRAHRA
jgi:dimethylhistidine N-methyltransferase